MPELRPFCALRYTRSAGDMADLLAPPYDVIDAAQAAALRDRSPLNCVRLILPDGDSKERYAHAATLLEGWRRDGILAADAAPTAYVYRQVFTADDRPATRLALFCALRLSPFDQGEVLPHEQTHSEPKRDRLALTVATRTQLSPIFVIARDEAGRFYSGLSAITLGRPAFESRTPDGVTHTLWVVDDGELAATLCAQAGAKPLLIADGHHRYETALAAARTLVDCVKARDVMVCIVSQCDPGLIVQPTHRILHGPPAGSDPAFDWRAALQDRFMIRDIQRAPGRTLEMTARAASAGELVAVAGCEGSPAWLMTPRDVGLAGSGPTGRHNYLAPVLFDSLIVRGMYDRRAEDLTRSGFLSYSRDPDEAVSGVGATGCAFLLPPIPLDDVWLTARSGERLPPKSTYFEPKIPSGLLFRPLS